MDYTGYSCLLFERNGPVLTVALNRPEALNAFNAEMELELGRFLAAAPEDSEARVIVLTGAGETFSAGGDFAYLRALVDDPAMFHRAMPRAKRLIFSLLDCPQPIIARINGPAVGLGATLALFCDITFAAEHAHIADPHVAIGLVAGDGGAAIWPQLAGFNRAKEFLLTGARIQAPEAARIGLINRCLPGDELDAAVNECAMKIAAMPKDAVQWTKAAVNLGLKQYAAPVLEASIAYEALSNTTRDHREAVAAILEKRKPRFEGG